jgi:hypothetical protein
MWCHGQLSRIYSGSVILRDGGRPFGVIDVP